MEKPSASTEITYKFTSSTGIDCQFVMRGTGNLPLKIWLHHGPDLSPTEVRELLVEKLQLSTITGAVYQAGLLMIDGKNDEIDFDSTTFSSDIETHLNAFAPMGLQLYHPDHAPIGSQHGSDQLVVSDGRFVPNAISMELGKLCQPWSIAETARSYYNIWGGTMTAKRLIVAQWTEMGSLSSFYMSKHNAVLIGFGFESEYYYNERGWSTDEIANMIELGLPLDKQISKSVFLEKINKTGAEVFLDNSTEEDNAISEALEEQGYELHIDGRPFNTKRNSRLEQIDNQASTFPRFICFSGQQRLEFQVNKGVKFENPLDYLIDISQMVEAALVKINQFNMKETGISSRAIDIANKMMGRDVG